MFHRKGFVIDCIPPPCCFHAHTYMKSLTCSVPLRCNADEMQSHPTTPHRYSQEKGTKKRGPFGRTHTHNAKPAAHTLSMSVSNYNRSIHSGLHIIAGYISLGLCVGRGFRGQSRGWDSSIWRSTSASQRSLRAAEFGHVLARRMGRTSNRSPSK